MLVKFSDYKEVYVEITKSEHKLGGSGGEFGACLWSHSSSRVSGDILLIGKVLSVINSIGESEQKL